MLHLFNFRARDQNRRNEQRVDPNQKKKKKRRLPTRALSTASLSSTHKPNSMRNSIRIRPRSPRQHTDHRQEDLKKSVVGQAGRSGIYSRTRRTEITAQTGSFFRHRAQSRCHTHTTSILPVVFQVSPGRSRRAHTDSSMPMQKQSSLQMRGAAALEPCAKVELGAFVRSLNAHSPSRLQASIQPRLIARCMPSCPCRRHRSFFLRVKRLPKRPDPAGTELASMRRALRRDTHGNTQETCRKHAGK